VKELGEIDTVSLARATLDFVTRDGSASRSAVQR
jgi:hypothetical protein